MSFLKSFLAYFVSPIVIIIVGFTFYWPAGITALLLYFVLLSYLMLPYFYRIKASKAYGADKMDESIIWMEKAHKTGRAGTETSISLAYLLLKKGDMERSERLFKELYESPKSNNDNRMQIKSNIALIKWKKGKLDEAIEMLDNLMKDYKTTNVYGSLGYLYIVKGDLDKALEFNLEAYEYNNTNSIILDNLGETYYLLGRYEEAEEIFKKLMTNNPQFPEAYYHHSCILEKLGNKEEALNMAKKANEYKTTFLSAVTKEQIAQKIKELEENPV